MSSGVERHWNWTGDLKWIRIRTATKAEVRTAGFPPALPTEEEEEEEMPFTVQNKAHSIHILFPSIGPSVSA
jgi:hypothetical protein